MSRCLQRTAHRKQYLSTTWQATRHAQRHFETPSNQDTNLGSTNTTLPLAEWRKAHTSTSRSVKRISVLSYIMRRNYAQLSCCHGGASPCAAGRLVTLARRIICIMQNSPAANIKLSVMHAQAHGLCLPSPALRQSCFGGSSRCASSVPTKASLPSRPPQGAPI